MTDDGYLSRNRPYLAAMQRQRRAKIVRIDYMPSKAARDAIEAMRARSRPGSVSATNSAVIDAIVAEWARLTGIQQTNVEKPETPAKLPELCDTYTRARMTLDAVNNTHMRATSDNLAECAGSGGRAGASPAAPEFLPPSQARAGASNFDLTHAKTAHPPATAAPEFLTASARANESGLCHATRAHANKSGSLPTGVNQARVVCGAKRRRDGQPCQGLSVPGKRRCKWHGGASTGPKTDEGRARSMANLRQYVNMETTPLKHSESQNGTHGVFADETFSQLL